MSCDSDADFALALQLQHELNYEEENSSNKIRNKLFSSDRNVTPVGSSGHNVVDEGLELFDPTPDIYALFREFDRIYFQGKLSCCEVKWSPRMTTCAGLCCYEGPGGLCSIRLSAPLLRLRPRKDLVQTLLHEMIHAYLFVTHNNKDHDAHGPEFLKHMHHINKMSGANVTVYHTFHDEVNVYRTHWWQCNGPCKTEKPFYGLVKRAVNRAPGPSDTWWSKHQKTCNGTFVKIKSPDTSKEGTKRKSEQPTGIDSPNKKLFAGPGHVLGSLGKKSKTHTNHSRSIEEFLNKVQNNDRTQSITSTREKKPSASIKEIDLTSSPKQSTSKLSDKGIGQKSIDNYFMASPNTKSSGVPERKQLDKSGTTKINKIAGKELYDWIISDDSDNESPQPSNTLTGTNGVTVIGEEDAMQVECPACNFKIPESKINEHLDHCLS